MLKKGLMFMMSGIALLSLASCQNASNAKNTDDPDKGKSVDKISFDIINEKGNVETITINKNDTYEDVYKIFKDNYLTLLCPSNEQFVETFNADVNQITSLTYELKENIPNEYNVVYDKTKTYKEDLKMNMYSYRGDFSKPFKSFFTETLNGKTGGLYVNYQGDSPRENDGSVEIAYNNVYDERLLLPTDPYKEDIIDYYSKSWEKGISIDEANDIYYKMRDYVKLRPTRIDFMYYANCDMLNYQNNYSNRIKEKVEVVSYSYLFSPNVFRGKTLDFLETSIDLTDKYLIFKYKINTSINFIYDYAVKSNNDSNYDSDGKILEEGLKQHKDEYVSNEIWIDYKNIIIDKNESKMQFGFAYSKFDCYKTQKYTYTYINSSDDITEPQQVHLPSYINGCLDELVGKDYTWTATEEYHYTAKNTYLSEGQVSEKEKEFIEYCKKNKTSNQEGN